MHNLEVFLQDILGMDPLLFLSYMFWAGIGVLLSLLFHATQRNTVNNTQVTFNWKFLFFNNYKRLLISFILILISIRFSKELISLDQNSFSAFIIGLCSDHIGKIIQQKLLNTSAQLLNSKQDQ